MINFKKIWKQGWPPLLVVILLLLIWQLTVSLSGFASWLLPGPLTVWQSGIKILPGLAVNTWATVKITLLGFLISSLFGILSAVALHLIPVLKRAFYPLLILSQNIPIIAIAPLLVIWFGFGILPKIMIITLVCFFPISINLLDGFLETDRNMLNYMQMIGASRRQIFFKIELPHALPSLFSGLKISGTYSVMGAVISEWLGASHGIGVFMTLSKASFRTDHVFDAIFIIVVLSLCLFGMIVLLEKSIIRWNPNRKGEN